MQIYSQENYSIFAAEKVTAHALIDVVIVSQCIQPSPFCFFASKRSGI